MSAAVSALTLSPTSTSPFSSSASASASAYTSTSPSSSSSSSSPSSSSSSLPLVLSSLDRNTGICELTLHSPRTKHALSLALLNELYEHLERIAEDEHVRCVIISSSGTVFCSGHDLRELNTMSHAQHQALFQRCSQVMLQLTSLPQPTIACVQGIATAAGCQLVASCDMAVASERATFAIPGAKTIGLFCSTPAVPVVRLIGAKKALELAVTGASLTASEALQYGLVSRVCAHVELHPETWKLAHQCAAASAQAVAIGKRGFYQQLRHGYDLRSAYDVAEECMTHNLAQSDADEGITAFLEKREPVWLQDQQHEEEVWEAQRARAVQRSRRLHASVPSSTSISTSTTSPSPSNSSPVGSRPYSTTTGQFDVHVPHDRSELQSHLVAATTTSTSTPTATSFASMPTLPSATSTSAIPMRARL